MDLSEASLQVTGHNRMQIDDYDPELSRAEVLLVGEICVQCNQGIELPLGRRYETLIIKVCPSLILSRNHLVLTSERQAEPVRDVVVKQHSHAGTPEPSSPKSSSSEPSSSTSPNLRR